MDTVYIVLLVALAATIVACVCCYYIGCRVGTKEAFKIKTKNPSPIKAPPPPFGFSKPSPIQAQKSRPHQGPIKAPSFGFKK